MAAFSLSVADSWDLRNSSPCSTRCGNGKCVWVFWMMSRPRLITLTLTTVELLIFRNSRRHSVRLGRHWCSRSSAVLPCRLVLSRLCSSHQISTVRGRFNLTSLSRLASLAALTSSLLQNCNLDRFVSTPLIPKRQTRLS